MKSINDAIPKKAAESFEYNQTIYEGIRKGSPNCDDMQYILDDTRATTLSVRAYWRNDDMEVVAAGFRTINKIKETGGV